MSGQHTVAPMHRPLARRILSIGFRIGSKSVNILMGFLPVRMRKRLRRGRKSLARGIRLYRSLGNWAALASRQLALAERRDAGEVPIRIGPARRILVRAGTTDTDVFRQHFVARELYDIPPVDSVNVIVDLGAHVGIATEVFRRQYPNARIISVEMDPENFKLCARNHADTPSQDSINAAIWSSSGTVAIEDVGEGNWAFRAKSVDESASTSASAVGPGSQVRAISFRDMVREHALPHIAILKVDIEGSEAELLESAWREILGMTDLVVMEVHDWIPGVRDRIEAVLREARQEFDLEITQSGEFMCIRPMRRSPASRGPAQLVNS